ncbi:cadherin-1-like [Scleropages formosus]|uniref:cadherin-1-like n=1 Tax=Scleropages formosus TaxID=113540 RepID=UPI0010FACD98|nr:cadherin-1-like [Scleropages formosus]
MGSFRILGLSIIVFGAMVSSFGCCEEDPQCQPGFSSEIYIFKVDRTHLHRGRRVGRVIFDDCSGRQRVLFNSEDSRFKVDTDGTVSLKRPVNLYDGHKSFSVHAWDSKGRKITTTVWVQYEPWTSQQEHEVDSGPFGQPVSTEPVPVLEFPQSSNGLKRRKRDWIIPPINFPENDKGPYPKEVVKIRTSNDKEARIHYSITGPGADEPPKGLFFMNKYSGQIFVTQPLDREKQAHYALFAHASASGGTPVEAPMEIIINVIDMNDNKPVFTEDTYEGSVPEATQVGYDILIVTATDADDPNTENGEIAYSILSQEPKEPNGNMFAINPNSGQIRLNSPGLDKEQYPQYILTVQAADQAGKGFPTTCTVIIKVTDSNDRHQINNSAPKFPRHMYSASVPENKKGAEVLRLFVYDSDEPLTPGWFTKFHIVQGNDDGLFNITNGPCHMEGVITTVKALDFEKKHQHTLLVAVENMIPFRPQMPTASATVIVNVEDVNEA